MSSPIVIAALYRFVQLDNFESLHQPLLTYASWVLTRSITSRAVF